MKFLTKLLIATKVIVLSGALSANSFVTMQTGDQKTFKSNGNLSTLEVIDTSGNWKQYSNFLGLENQWVWTAQGDQRVYLYNAQGEYDLLANFSDKVGKQYNVNLSSCTKKVTLASRGVTETVAAGTFADTVLLTFEGPCANRGLAFAVFAPEVGLISYAYRGVNGLVRNEMVDGTVNGVIYPKFSGVKFSAEFPAGPVFTNVEGKVSAYVTVKNESYQSQEFTFQTGQLFEITIYDANGVMVNKWSTNKRFTQVEQNIEIPVGESKQFGGEIDLVDFSGQALDVGTYRLRIELTGTNKPEASVFTAIPFAAEAPIYVDQRITID